jgi:AraC-like DNA-binding protein
VDKDQCITRINQEITAAHTYLKEAQWLFITFGSSFVYKLKDTGNYVGNCHKVPAVQFEKELLTGESIIKEYSELIIYSLLINFFVKFAYNRINAEALFPKVQLDKQKEYIQKFNALMTYIDTHYTENLDLETVAKSVGFSKYHFSRLFKQYTNFTFGDYLCYRRIKAAEELLANADLSITEVAIQAGFPSISTFNRLFKQHKSCTPSEYRSKEHTFHNP